MQKNLQSLYQTVILQHNREPFHYEKRPEAGLVLEAYNPICGDQYKLYLDIEENKVVNATFHGYGCAISKAATSILVQRIIGQSLDDLSTLFDTFFEVVNPPEEDAPVPADEELQAFAGTRQYPERLQCATLSWQALKDWLEKEAE
jgi:nitrogen fixation NifU-like protein